MRKDIILLVALSTSAAASGQVGRRDPVMTVAQQNSALDVRNPSDRTRQGPVLSRADTEKNTPPDVRVGLRVADVDNVRIGRIDAVDSESATVNYGRGSTKVPLRAFGRAGAGLIMAMTRAEFLDKAAHPR